MFSLQMNTESAETTMIISLSPDILPTMDSFISVKNKWTDSIYKDGKEIIGMFSHYFQLKDPSVLLTLFPYNIVSLCTYAQRSDIKHPLPIFKAKISRVKK